jgi:hypothetical protein
MDLGTHMVCARFYPLELGVTPGPESAHSLRRPILPAVLPWPTKRRPCETIGPKPFARPSCLLVDPGDIRPPQAPNLCVDFKIINPKILGPACDFDFHFGDGRSEGAPVERCFWTLSDSVKNNLLLSSFGAFKDLYLMPQKSALSSAYALEISILSFGVKNLLGAPEVHPMGVAPKLWVDC